MKKLHPIETDTAPVRVTGEGLHEVLWRGRQWAVTAFGIEALDGTYAIEAKRLAEGFSEWSWIMQLSDKTWVDLPDFTTAFMVAIVLHDRAPGFDKSQILDDFRRGMKSRAEP